MAEAQSRFKIFFILIALCVAAPSSLFAEDADDLYREGRFAEAEEAYKKADMDNPRDIRYRYNRGCAAYQNSDYKGAVAAFSSVLRRARDKNLLYKASFNMGNTAFVQGDFASAAEFYKRAIVINPNKDDAKYNLELALKKMSESKDNKDKQCPKDKNDDNDKQKKDDDQKGSNQDKGKDQNKEQNEEQNNSKEGENDKQEEGAKNEENKKQDLSGELSAANPMENDQTDKSGQQPMTAAMLDKKKAEALLDNIKEDRAKILQFQIPKGERDGTKSGKAW